MSPELSARERAYVVGVLEAVMALFPDRLHRKDVALAMRVDATDLSRKLTAKGLTYDDVALMTSSLQDLCSTRKAADPDGRPRYEDIEAILADGIAGAGRAMEQALAPAYRARINSRSAPEAEVRKKVGEGWHRTAESITGGEPTREQILEIGRAAWPGMPDAQSAFVFLEIGRLLRDAATDGPSVWKAVGFCERAESRQAGAVIKAVLERLRCLERLFRMVGVPRSERDRAYATAEDRFRMIQVLCGVYRLPYNLLAEIQKARGEFERSYDSTPGVEVPILCERAKPYFLEAADNYAVAWTSIGTMDDDERADPNHRKASVSHNWGYCELYAGKAEARKRLEDAAKYYLRADKGDKAQWVAYNLKYLAIWHESVGESALAVWCVKASEGIYKVEGVVYNSHHFLNLREHKKRVAGSALADTMPRPDEARPHETPLHYAERLLHEYGKLTSGRNRVLPAR